MENAIKVVVGALFETRALGKFNDGFMDDKGARWEDLPCHPLYPSTPDGKADPESLPVAYLDASYARHAGINKGDEMILMISKRLDMPSAEELLEVKSAIKKAVRILGTDE